VQRQSDRSFEPQLIPKHQTRWAGFDDKIISLYARGMTVREIQAHLEEIRAVSRHVNDVHLAAYVRPISNKTPSLL